MKIQCTDQRFYVWNLTIVARYKEEQGEEEEEEEAEEHFFHVLLILATEYALAVYDDLCHMRLCCSD